MEDLMWLAAYRSLGQAIDDLAASPEVNKSEKLCKRAEAAKEFHAELGRLADALVAALRGDRTTLDLLTRDARSFAGERHYGKYTSMAAAGADSMEVCKVAIADGQDLIGTVGALRAAFGLSLKDAIQIRDRAAQELTP